MQKEAKTWMQRAEVTNSRKPALNAKIKAYSRARQIYLELHDTLSATNTLKTIADLHLGENDLAIAKKELLEVLNTYQSIRFPQLYYTYDLLRAVCKAQGDIAGEIFYAIRMIKTTDSVQTDIGDLTYFNIRMAEAYRDAGMNERSLVYTKKAFDLSRSRSNSLPPILAASAYGLDLVGNDSPARAVTILSPFYKGETKADTIAKVHADYILCLAYTALKKPDLAEQSGLSCVTLAESFYSHHSDIFTHHAMVLFYAGLSEAYILHREFKKAEWYLNRIHFDRSVPNYLIDLRRWAFDRARIDSGMERFDSSLYYFQLYKVYSDSLYGIAKTVHFTEINTKYETEKKDKDLLLLQKENRLQQEQAQRSRFARNTMIGGILLLLAFSILIFNRYRIKQRLAARLEGQKQEILDKNTTLEKLLHENEWLLREVHHRVKNNLQMVTSLLQSQSVFLTDPKAVDAVAESQSRVQAMALIHQKLYSNVAVSTIDMQDYITDLIDYLRDMVRPDQRIIFDIQIEKVSLDVNQAIPIGLILNEVITNSIKYAFYDIPDPRIRVWLRKMQDQKIELFAADNGQGLPPGLDVHAGNSFGFRLIQGLAEDLEATLTIVNNGGVEYFFSFQATAFPPLT
ncbi:sensor histidine kinase [Puia dinghuensis]|uniref:sensor histidine kinase n=1 Tax=Puia dinghuensis TaxID=1792502 RepID=UPI001668DF69|nr:sensor histidine kinase [Puia dinghuensis]